MTIQAKVAREYEKTDGTFPADCCLTAGWRTIGIVLLKVPICPYVGKFVFVLFLETGSFDSRQN